MMLTQPIFQMITKTRILYLWLLLLTPFFCISEEKNTGTLTFKMPQVLLQNKIEDRQDILKLMQSADLEEQLLTIAKQIEMTSELSTSDSEEIAINSMLGRSERVLALIDEKKYPLSFFHYALFAKSKKKSATSNIDFQQRLKREMESSLSKLSGESLHRISYALGWSLSMGQDYMHDLFRYYKKTKTLSRKESLNLLANYQLYKVYEQVLPIALPLLKIEQNKRYEVQTDVLIKTPDGATISAIIVKKRDDAQKRPTAFQFSIYADEAWQTKTAMHAAAHGYIGVIANTRGKGKSPDEIVPWEHDGKDATAVIDWITKQSWSDGQVAMYGGSYLGFTQWAAAKYMHPALKTIVPYAAANPMTGLPIQNNIFLTGNYQWAFHVTNNKTMDQSVYTDWQHWQNAYDKLFESGRAFKDIDKIEGTPNPWFQKWLKHPSFDSYYQSMLPYQQDYKKINIPVLSITGYFDGASISAIDFLTRHYQYNKNANHSLLIGPYSHGTAQGIPRSHHRNYQLDPVALEKDTVEITFQWFDHVLFGRTKPILIKDKINYQLMGSNTWQHETSFEELNRQAVSYHLGTKIDKDLFYNLTLEKQKKSDYVEQMIDLAERKTQRNVSPRQIIQKELHESSGLIFATKVFTETQELAGAITGFFALSINKKDVDIGFNFYEMNSRGEVFHLNNYISRASYAQNMSERHLLTPYKKTIIPIVNARMTARLIEKGSRLVLVLNVNKNTNAQVNMGTGKDVSEETITDAGEPLKIKWFSDSQINIPLKSWHK